MKKKLIFTAFLIVVAAQFFFPLKTVHDQYMAKKYGTVETCAVKLNWYYHGSGKIKIIAPESAKFKEFAVKNKELAKFVNEKYRFLEAEAVMKVLGQTRTLEDVLVCGVSMKNPPDNALEILKAAAKKAAEDAAKKSSPAAAKESETQSKPEACESSAKETKPHPEAAPAGKAEAAAQEQKIDAPKQTPASTAAQARQPDASAQEEKAPETPQGK